MGNGRKVKIAKKKEIDESWKWKKMRKDLKWEVGDNRVMKDRGRWRFQISQK